VDEVLSVPLRDALRNRATQDNIRQIHLRGDNTDLLASILSSLTPDGESVQEKRIQSITLEASSLPELSNFFARSYLPKLRYLHIDGEHRTPLLEHLTSLTTGLTTLTLRLTRPSPPPTTSQLISILVSNPNLRNLSLEGAAFPDDIDGSGIRVPLRYLKTIALDGKFRGVFGLINRLDLPATLDSTDLRTTGSTVEDTLQAFGQYMRGYFQRDIRFQDRLEVDASFFDLPVLRWICRGSPRTGLSVGTGIAIATFSARRPTQTLVQQWRTCTSVSWRLFRKHMW
jgi:hypothetical protein